MVFNDIEQTLRLLFMDEFVRSQYSTWPDFINFTKQKDLGIISLSWIGPQYKIVDHKKWTLAKIKYGI
jgi:hypothetical protein